MTRGSGRLTGACRPSAWRACPQVARWRCQGPRGVRHVRGVAGVPGGRGLPGTSSCPLPPRVPGGHRGPAGPGQVGPPPYPAAVPSGTSEGTTARSPSPTTPGRIVRSFRDSSTHPLATTTRYQGTTMPSFPTSVAPPGSSSARGTPTWSPSASPAAGPRSGPPAPPYPGPSSGPSSGRRARSFPSVTGLPASSRPSRQHMLT